MQSTDGEYSHRVGFEVGAEGTMLGCAVGFEEGTVVGLLEGTKDGLAVGVLVGAEGITVGS